MFHSAVLQKPRLSVKTQTLATLAAIIAAVAVPQVFHLIGSISEMGTSLGEAFLPMHLPIILIGLLAGPYAGAISGFLSPALSFLLTGMPGAVMLPFMMIELCVYGLAAGLLRSASLPSLVKILIVQAAGRLIRAGAILLSVYAFGNEAVRAEVIWTSITAGLFGIVLQWVLLPLILFRVENARK